MVRAIRKILRKRSLPETGASPTEIRDYANQRYSWATVGEITRNVYASLGKLK